MCEGRERGGRSENIRVYLCLLCVRFRIVSEKSKGVFQRKALKHACMCMKGDTLIIRLLLIKIHSFWGCLN